MKDINREALLGEERSRLVHSRNVAARAVESDDGGQGAAGRIGQVGVEADGLAAALET